MKNISAPSDIKEKPQGEIPIKERTDLHTDIKEKSTTVTPRENTAKLRTRRKAEAEQKVKLRERQTQQAKNNYASKTGKKAVADRTGSAALRKP